MTNQSSSADAAPRPIIIDTDPGQDDAIAILAALAAPELEVLGITAVAGNVPLELTARNARILVELAGRPDVPVFAGCDRPLRRDLVTAEHVHGKTGIDGADLPEPATALQPQHAVEWMTETLLAAGEREITICPVGPMTNVATVLENTPEAASRIREIVCMGGGFFGGGNTTPTAEFNVFVDPDAAQIVLHSGAPVTMLPLDVTHKALMTDAWIDQVRALGTRTGAAAAGMLDFYERFDVDKYGTTGGPPPRPQRDRLPPAPRPLPRPPLQRRGRNRLPPHPGHDRGRLVERHHPPPQLPLHHRRKRRRLLRPAPGPPRPPPLTYAIESLVPRYVFGCCFFRVCVGHVGVGHFGHHFGLDGQAHPPLVPSPDHGDAGVADGGRSPARAGRGWRAPRRPLGDVL